MKKKSITQQLKAESKIAGPIHALKTVVNTKEDHHPGTEKCHGTETILEDPNPILLIGKEERDQIHALCQEIVMLIVS